MLEEDIESIKAKKQYKVSDYVGLSEALGQIKLEAKNRMNKFIELIPKDVKDIAKMFAEMGYELHLVGGCVRDMIMGDKPHDWDMCTNATPSEMKHICDKYDIFHTDVGEEHGTIIFYLNNNGYEITTYRIDGDYSDGRHPDEVAFTNSLKKDLSRRDFTMNAIAMQPETGKIVDPFYGEKDIESKKLIAVGDADERIKEDSLRMLRAIRFAIKYELQIDDDLLNSIHHNVNLIDKVSKERITDEFRKILSADKPIRKYFIQFSDLITTIIPEIEKCVNFEQNNKYHKNNVYEHMLCVVDLCKTDKFEIKMAALLHDIGKPNAYVIGDDGYGHFYGHPEISFDICKSLLTKRFRLKKSETTRILELVEFHDKDIAPTTKSVRKALNRHGEDYMRDWFILKQADMDDHIYPDDKHPKSINDLIPIMESILKSDTAFSLKQLHMTGNILMRHFNLKPGKIIGDILNQLLYDVIEGKVENTGTALIKDAEDIYNNIIGNK